MMKAKIKKISKRVNAFGGIHFVMDELKRSGVPEIIDQILGTRVKQAKYSYSDIILGWVYANLCGAERLQDAKIFRKHFSNIPDTELCSPSQIARIFKSLATKTENIKSSDGNNQICNHELLSELLITLAIRLGLLNKDKDYTLDYDCTLIHTKKYDANQTYKDGSGYAPAVSLIDHVPVGIEGRNGNSSPYYGIQKALYSTLQNLKNHGVNIKRIRMDGASYNLKLIDQLNKDGFEYFIRVKNSNTLYQDCRIQKWQKIQVGSFTHEIAGIDFSPAFQKDKTYRVILTRILGINKPKKNKYTDDSLIYRGIITNNTTMTDEEVVRFYNNRGAAEKNFDILKNDFNWSRVPFSFMNENLVYLFIGAISCVLYRYTLSKFARKFPLLKITDRLKAFISKFIVVAIEYVVRGSDLFLLIPEDGRNYEVLRE